MYTKVVRVNSNSGTGTQDITFTASPSWTPKAAIFQWNRANTQVSACQEHASYGFGFTDGTNQKCIATASEDNQARGDSAKISRNAVICTLNPSGTIETIDSIATFSQWLSNGIQLNWIDAPAAQFYLTVTFLGGDDITNVDVGTLATGTGTGDISVTSLSYQPDFGMFLSGGTNTETSPVVGGFLSIGAATSSSAQWVQSIYSLDNPVTMSTRQYYSHSNVVVSHTTAVDGLASFSSFNSNGFTLNISDAFPASFPIYYLVIKGGSFAVGNNTEPAATGNQTITTNKDTKVAMVFGLDTSTANSPQAGCMWTCGSGSSPSEVYGFTFEDTNGVADSIVVSYATALVYNNITANATASSSTIDDVADMDSVSSTGFVLNWTNIGQARPFRYITFGNRGPTLFQGSISETAVTVSDSVSIPDIHVEPPDTPGPNKKAIVAGNEFTIIEGSANPTYIPLLGTQWAPRDNTTESYAKWKVRPYGGTFSNLTLSAYYNTVGSTATIRVRKNSANGNQVLSISSGSTGTFEDTTHTDTFANGDFFSISNTWTYVASSSNYFTGDLRIVFKSTDTNTVTQYGAVGGIGINENSSTTYIGLAGYGTDSINANDKKTKFKTQIVLRNLQTVITSNDRTSSTTLRIYKSNVPSGNGRQSISIGSGVTGHLEDTSSDTEDVITADNYAAYKIVTGTGSYESLSLFLVSISGESYYGVSNILCSNGSAEKNLTQYTCFAGWAIITAPDQLGITADKILFDSTWRNSNVYIYANSINSGTSTFTARKNLTTDLSISFSVAAAATGLFEDAINTASITASDSTSIKIVTSGTDGALNIGTMNNEFLEFVPGPNNKTQLLTFESFQDDINPSYHPIPLGYAIPFTDNTTESYVQVAVRPYGGTFSNLWIGAYSSDTGVTITLRLRKNGNNGNQTISIGAAATGEFQDTVNTDTFANGDLASISSTCVGGSGGSLSATLGIDFRSTDTNTVSMIGSAAFVTNDFIGSSITMFESICNRINIDSTSEDPTQTLFKSMCSLRNLQTIISSNARTTATTVRTRNNGSNGHQLISIGSGVTGRLEDTTNIDSAVGNNDLVNFSVTTGTGTQSLHINIISVTVESDTGINHVIRTDGNYVYQSINSNLTRYDSISGYGYFVDYTNYYTRSNISFNADWKNLVVKIGTNTLNSGTSTLTGRLNGTTDTSLSASIGFGATGLFEDTTHTVAVTAGDLLEYKLVTSGTSGAIGIGSTSSELEESEVTGELKYGTITESPSVSVSESLVRLQVIIKPISDTPTVSVSESLVRIQTLTRPISDTPTISVSENLVRGLSYPRPITNEPEVSVSAGTLERIQYLIKLITNEPEVTIPAETLAKVAAHPRPISDTPSITVSETLEKILTDIRSITNESSVSIPEETLSKYAIRPRPISDTPSITVSESLARIQTIIKLITNEPEVTISALLTGNFLISKIINESPSVSVSETLERIQYIIKLISETPEVTISELLEGSIPVKSRSITEPSIDTTPTTIERIATFPRPISDTPTISISETLARVQTLIKLITNEPEVTTSDVASTLALIIRTLTEPSTNISEEITRIQSLIKLISDPEISVNDTVTGLRALLVSILESRIKWYYSLLTRKIPEGET